MPRKAYLTIDDSPNTHTDEFLDALIDRHVPAILFCRGDLIDENPDPVIRAIKNGFIIGSHGYHHKRASTMSFDAACENITRTDALIDACYNKADIARPGKYHRFAYMDRGMGPWFVEPASVPGPSRAYVESMIKQGLGNDPAVLPTREQIETKNALQSFLKQSGFLQVPFENINHEFYTQSEMATAIDAMFTYSTSDWAATARHADKGYDLKALMDNDAPLARTDTSHIILAHDQAEIHDTTLSLVDHMLSHDFTFESIRP